MPMTECSFQLLDTRDRREFPVDKDARSDVLRSLHFAGRTHLDIIDRTSPNASVNIAEVTSRADMRTCSNELDTRAAIIDIVKRGRHKQLPCSTSHLRGQ